MSEISYGIVLRKNQILEQENDTLKKQNLKMKKKIKYLSAQCEKHWDVLYKVNKQIVMLEEQLASLKGNVN